ncbi:MAG: hypothetical protein GY940_15430 [bacterium]|nr:hypothetical protein [bacterium]
MEKTKNIGKEVTLVTGQDEEETQKSNKKQGISQTQQLDDQPTMQMDYGAEQTIDRRTVSSEKTMLMFGKDDIQQKLNNEVTDIPEADMEDLSQEYLSSLIKSPFPNRTNDEQVKINRNFLRDAEPFKIERLMEELKSTPKELLTGFRNLDNHIRIPLHKVVLVTARPRHGKTAFMLNMMLNMSYIYPQKHFLYYSYGEPRRDIEIKLINMSGEKPFDPIEGISSNFERWKHEFKQLDTEALKKKSETEIEYTGLKKFLSVSHRLHVIDANYNINDLVDSIDAFTRTLTVGAVYIDYLQAIRPEKEQNALPRVQQLQGISDKLRELGNDTPFPVIVGVQFETGDSLTPEYDTLSTTHLKDAGDPEQTASLIIGLQNYTQSMFIGSNWNENFKSRFYSQNFKKAEKMPDIFKDKHPNTVILAKVLANQGRPQPEVELLFNKWLMKITDPKDEAINK